ncbi:hypothetical protein HY972_01665 [Candidatus Kaiserbacteria bacterium]|nr:hypothetical protein [Candidatus Kaiserbacteria bacterium]
MSELLISIGLLVVIAILVIVIILLLSNLGVFFTKIAQGTTAFITAGDSLKEILPNIGGYKMSDQIDLESQHWLIPEKDRDRQIAALFHDSMRGTKKFQKWLWKKFGVKFVSWFWPQIRVHKFDIRKGGRRRIEARNEVGPDAPLRSRVVDSPEKTVVDSLLFLAPRPVYMEGVELAGDNSKINLLLLPVFRQVIPSLPVFNLKGDFFTLIDAAIEAAVVDFFAKHRVAVYKGGKDNPKAGELANDYYDSAQSETQETSPLTYAHWLKLTKAGEGSPLEKSLRHLNFSREYVAKLKRNGGATKLVNYIKSDLIHGDDAADIPVGNVAQMIPSGIVPRFGYALVSFRIVEWEPHKSTEPLALALLAKETEFHNAEGVRQKAYGERDAKLATAVGDSGRVNQVMTSFVDKRVDPNVAAEVIKTMLRTENIRDSKVTTYVEGGTSASVMVPASPPTQPTK